MLITSGQVLAQRFYDIADEIDLLKAQSLIANRLRSPQAKPARNSFMVRRPPLEIDWPTQDCGVPALPTKYISIRVYDVGVVAITFALPLVKPESSEDIVDLAASVLDSSANVTQVGAKIATELLALIAPACRKPELSPVNEDYTVFIVEKTEPNADVETFRAKFDLPRWLLGERGVLSQEERRQTLETALCYDPNQVVLITWNSAIVLAPQDADEIVAILEIAGMQLLEVRAYDQMVTQATANLYAELDRPASIFFKSARFQRLSRDIMRLFVDVTDAAERAENSLQALGDTWYARLHRAAINTFAVPHLEKRLNDKLELVRQINELLVHQITTRQSMRLEIAIVFLIALEIVLALLKIV